MKTQKRLLLAACCCIVLQVYSQSPGSLDLSFAGGGIGKYDVGPQKKKSDEDFRAVLPMADGSAILAGNCTKSGGNFDYYRMIVTRIKANGSIDSTFGQSGTGIVYITNGIISYLAAATLQSDGKILLAGSDGSNFSVVRLNNDGSPDSSFDGDGKSLIPVGLNNNHAQSIAIQNDGKILLAGYGFNYFTSSEDLSVVRLNTDGSLDNSFDGDGKIMVDARRNERAQSIAIQIDGKILLAGYSYSSDGSFSEILIVRLNTNGGLDSSFTGNGKLVIPVGSRQDYAQSIAVLSNGKILLGGYSSNGGKYDFAVVRLKAKGGFDSSFMGNGKLLIPVGSGNDVAYSMALRPNGKIVLAGYSSNGSNRDFAVVRLNADGSADSSFDGDGKKLIPIGSRNDVAYCMGFQNDDKILLAGYSYNGSNNDLAVLRLKVGGRIDHSFARNGKLSIALAQSDQDIAASAALQSDGKILLAGSSWSGSNDDFSVARLNTDGSLDNGFDGDGKLLIPMGSGDDYAQSITLQSDGKILLAGNSDNGQNFDFSVARLNADGSPDKSFNGDGKILIPVSNYGDYANTIAVQKDGKIMVAGTYNDYSNGAFSAVRLKANGSLDSSFDGDGKLLIKVGSGRDYAYSMALQKDGKILLAGSSEASYGNFDFALMRLNSDGSLDKTFGSDGKLMIPVGSKSDEAHSIAVQKDGKILLAGVSQTEYKPEGFSVLRLKANGNLDSSFDGDGKKIIILGNSIDYVHSIAVQSDGKILLTGNKAEGNNVDNSDFVLMRLNTDGSLDSSFDSDGIAIIYTPFYRETASSSVLQQDGKLVVAGYGGADEPGDKFVAMRFLCGGNTLSQPDNHFVKTTDGEGNAAINNISAKSRETKLIIPNLLHPNEPWRIHGLPAQNNIVITDMNGRILFRQTNYQNNKAFTGWAQGMYYYRINFINKEGKEEVSKGKLVLVQ